MISTAGSQHDCGSDQHAVQQQVGDCTHAIHNYILSGQVIISLPYFLAIKHMRLYPTGGKYAPNSEVCLTTICAR